MSCWLLWRKISIDLYFLSDFSLPARCRRHEAFLLLSLSLACFCVIAGSKWAHDVFETTCIRLYLMLMRWDETFPGSSCSRTVVPPHVAWVEAFLNDTLAFEGDDFISSCNLGNEVAVMYSTGYDTSLMRSQRQSLLGSNSSNYLNFSSPELFDSFQQHRAGTDLLAMNEMLILHQGFLSSRLT